MGAMRNKSHARKLLHTNYTHGGVPICQATFLFLHSIGIKRLKNIRKAFHQDGVQPRVHGNTRRLPKHTLTLESVEYVVRFLLNYFEQHRLLLPGRVPGYARDDIKLLPSSTSKRGLEAVLWCSRPSSRNPQGCLLNILSCLEAPAPSLDIDEANDGSLLDLPEKQHCSTQIC